MMVLATAASTWRCTAACIFRCQAGTISSAVTNAARTSGGTPGSWRAVPVRLTSAMSCPE